MFLDLLQPVIMVGHETQQGLTGLASKILEVAREVCWHLHIGVILKGAVEDLQDLVQCIGVLGFVDVEVFAKLPSSAGQTAQQVQNGLSLSLGQGHFLVVDGDPLPPFPISR